MKPNLLRQTSRAIAAAGFVFLAAGCSTSTY
jgi:hypothetical protein